MHKNEHKIYRSFYSTWNNCFSCCLIFHLSVNFAFVEISAEKSDLNFNRCDKNTRTHFIKIANNSEKDNERWNVCSQKLKILSCAMPLSFHLPFLFSQRKNNKINILHEKLIILHAKDDVFRAKTEKWSKTKWDKFKWNGKNGWYY